MPNSITPRRNIIVIGASAGGLEAVKQLVAALPADLPAALFLVIHFPSYATSYLPEILNRNGLLQAAHAVDGEPIEHGRVYVAPPDYHLLVGDGAVVVSHGPKENRLRPAIDPLFRSAARVYGPRVAGVILSGTMTDGTAGLIAIKGHDGISIIQDPADALFPGMPRNALEHDHVDYSLPASEIADLLVKLSTGISAKAGLVRTSKAADDCLKEESAVMDWDSAVSEMVERDTITQIRGGRSGAPSVYSCPECGGVLWQADQGDINRFRCHVGHIYNAEDLLNAQGEAVEAAMWLAIRTMSDQTVLARQLAAREHADGNSAVASRLADLERIIGERAGILQKMVESSSDLFVGDKIDAKSDSLAMV